MPLDALGCTRTTMTEATGRCFVKKHQNVNLCRGRDRSLEFDLEPGILSKRTSLACADYVPAFCTHRPSLLPMDDLVRRSELVLYQKNRQRVTNLII